MNKQVQPFATLKSSSTYLRALGAAGLFVLSSAAVSSAAVATGSVDASHRFAQKSQGLEEQLGHFVESRGTAHYHVPTPFGHSAIVLSYRQQRLSAVVDDLSRRSGIEFKVPADLARDAVARSAKANTWADAVKELLKGYNYLGYSGDNGKLKRVVITGRNGNGDDASSAAIGKAAASRNHRRNLLAYQAETGNLPEKYRNYHEGSVSPISIPFNRLNKMKIGEKIPLSLPTGEYEVVHDNAFEHRNGDKTWVGYLDQEGKEYRVVITSGKDGGVGQIISPDGEYQIDLENGTNYLVNVNASGLIHGSLEDDQAFDETDLFSTTAGGTFLYGQDSLAGIGSETNRPIDPAKASDIVAKAMGFSGAAGRAAKGKPTKDNGSTTTDPGTSTGNDTTTDSGSTTNTVNACDTTGPIIVNGVDKCSAVAPSIIDVLVVYTTGMDTTALDTRLNQLFALTNQAYIDSKIVMALRMVGKQLVSYTDQNANTTALSDLTYGRGAFTGIDTLRTELGADLVTLIRPFYYGTQKNCGYAWINGINGSALSASRGFAAISDGTDRAGTAYYCNNYTFAHETGHNLGNVHERGSNAPSPGAYEFSYGWGKSGTLGTIMSYLRPLVPYFANPNILCSGLPCGVPTTEPTSADNASTINLTGGIVANFKPTKVSN